MIGIAVAMIEAFGFENPATRFFRVAGLQIHRATKTQRTICGHPIGITGYITVYI